VSLPPSVSPLERLWCTLEDELQTIRDRGLLRTLSTVEAVEGATVRIQGRWMVLWCGNDYLGLSAHPRVIHAARAAADQWGVGARASRLLAGSTALHQQLEDSLAAFFGADAAAVFASGYLTNLGVLQALVGPEDVILMDRLSHASLVDAARLTRATLRVFRHNDAGHLHDVLRRYTRARRRIVVTEGLFSMDGDYAPLPELLEVSRRHDALLYVDDAHAAFAVGRTGRGSPERAGVAHEGMLYMGTLGKALGCQGGFVVGPKAFVTYLHNRARSFIYATALAAPVVAAALEALRLVTEDAAPRLRLGQRVESLHAMLRRLGVLRTDDPTHIVPVVVGSAAQASELSASLWERGMFAPAIRPPTVPERTARLRLSLSALHTDEQLDRLGVALSEALRAPVPSR